MADEAKIVDHNRRRSAREYFDHLKSMIAQLVCEGMEEPKWKFLMQCHNAQFARQYPNAGESSDDTDPQFGQKQEIYSQMLQYARHRCRPTLCRAVELSPPEHVPNPAAHLPPLDVAARDETMSLVILIRHRRLEFEKSTGGTRKMRTSS